MFNEDNTVEQMLINAATQSGWQYEWLAICKA